jgi:hypothetical protein
LKWQNTGEATSKRIWCIKLCIFFFCGFLHPEEHWYQFKSPCQFAFPRVLLFLSILCRVLFTLRVCQTRNFSCLLLWFKDWLESCLDQTCDPYSFKNTYGNINFSFSIWRLWIVIFKSSCKTSGNTFCHLRTQNSSLIRISLLLGQWSLSGG